MKHFICLRVKVDRKIDYFSPSLKKGRTAMEEIVHSVSVITGIVLIALLVQWYRIRQRELVNKERLALIEKGVYEFPGDVRKVGYAKYLLI